MGDVVDIDHRDPFQVGTQCGKRLEGHTRFIHGRHTADDQLNGGGQPLWHRGRTGRGQEVERLGLRLLHLLQLLPDASLLEGTIHQVGQPIRLGAVAGRADGAPRLLRILAKGGQQLPDPLRVALTEVAGIAGEREDELVA